MSHELLLSRMRMHRSPDYRTLDEYFEHSPQEVFNRMNDVARQSPELVDEEAVEWAIRRIENFSGSVFALLFNLAAKNRARGASLIARYRSLMEAHPATGLGCAGHYLHEYHPLFDDEWLVAAVRYFDHNPEGAWDMFKAASMYESHLITPELVEAFEARRTAGPRNYVVSMLSLGHRYPDLPARVLRIFPDHPAEAVDGTSFAARSEAALLTPELVAAMLRHFDAATEKAWEFFDGACRAKPSLFDDALLGALAGREDSGDGKIFSIVRHLMEVQPERIPPLMDRYVALVRRHPDKGISSARHGFQRDEAKLLRPDLVRAVCDGFAHDAYPAYEFLRHCARERPELIGSFEVEAALRNIEHATNFAFGFFQELATLRPEFTRECTLALFEALAREPVHRAFFRDNEIEGLIAVSQAAHVKTGLEKTLREPPQVGSRRARALMAIMFRQKLRARRHVLLEALRYAGRVVLWRKEPAEKYSPVWDFLLFIIDNSGDDAVSTAAAERFLEGAFQLSYLYRTPAEHEEFLRRLDIGYPPKRAFPRGMEFLEADAELVTLHALVHELGMRFGTEPRIAAFADFAGRLESAERELRAIEEQLSKANTSRRRKLEKRRRTLNEQVACWRDPAYVGAFGDPDALKQLPEERQDLLRREIKDLSKKLRDALRAEAIRIAVAAVERSRLDLYRARLKEALGRDVDLAEVEPRILPAFLWFAAIGNMRNNTKYLRRLIEDRIEKRPHDWLRTEAPVLDWAERMRKGQPGIRLERWRAPFSKEFQYRPGDALAEKKRRIKADLAQARVLLEKAGAKGIASESYEELAARFEELKRPPQSEKEAEGEEKAAPPAPADPSLLQEISMNLERVRLSEATPDSDFEGTIQLTVETDPFEILFMGEYGFASCLSLRGSNSWSAVSNAIDLDKAIVWAKEPGGNVVGRRLLALTPGGILVFRTYTNRHGLALDRVFDEFVEQLAAHCGTTITHAGQAGPLLSDRWYDDGAI
jgi:hypothetical protein